MAYRTVHDEAPVMRLPKALLTPAPSTPAGDQPSDDRYAQARIAIECLLPPLSSMTHHVRKRLGILNEDVGDV